MEVSHSFDTITSPPPPSPPGHATSTPCPLTCPSSVHPAESTSCNTERMMYVCQSETQPVIMSPSMARSNTMAKSNTMGRCSTMRKLNNQCSTMTGIPSMARSISQAPSYCTTRRRCEDTYHCQECGTLAFPDPPSFIPHTRRNLQHVR